jgi:putative ABC transport system substrate-binding protein
MRRRDFIAGLGGAAAWPVAARAQQGERVRRIGFLSTLDENDPVAKSQRSAWTRALTDLGWTDGRNVRMDFRWAGGDGNRIRALAQELVSLQPDIVLTNASPETVALQRETRTIPIVFVGVADPVANGIVAALNQPTARTGLSSQIQSSRHSGNNVACPRSTPSKRLILCSRESYRENRTARRFHSQGHSRRAR